MSVLKNKRGLSKLEFYHNARRMRKEITMLTLRDLRTAYQSWRGNYKKRFNAYYRVRFMDKLYNELFIVKHTS
jgi:hypothetical protein